jgi:cytoskeletal protein CcmA (bactofilin family)
LQDLLRRTSGNADPDTARRSGGGSGEFSVSVIGPGVTVTGDVSARGELRIEGTVKGTIESRGPVIVAAEGAVEGDVHAEMVVVGGTLEGEIDASQMARLESTARVTADVTAPTMAIADGARFEGAVDMGPRASTSSSEAASAA